MEKTVKISILVRKKEFKMEKIVEISILRRKKEFKMEKIVKISILVRKKEFKMEKTVKISILGRKRRFKMEKTVKISILKLGCEWHLTPLISYNKKLLCQEITRKSSFQRNRFCRVTPAKFIRHLKSFYKANLDVNKPLRLWVFIYTFLKFRTFEPIPSSMISPMPRSWQSAVS